MNKILIMLIRFNFKSNFERREIKYIFFISLGGKIRILKKVSQFLKTEKKNQ